MAETVAKSSDAGPPAALGGVVPILRVTSLDRSIAYYVNVLGFALRWRAGTVASVVRSEAALMLSEGDQGHAGTWLWIPTTNVDDLHRELRDRGAQVRHPPTNYPWGSRECQIEDPDGHVLRFGSDSASDAPLGPWRDGEGRLWTPQSDGSWRLA